MSGGTVATVDPKAVALALGVIRVGVGATLLLTPRLAQRVWLGPGRSAPRLARALAVRDLVVGGLALRSLARDEGMSAWLRASAVADAGDVAGHLLAGPRLPFGRRVVWAGSAAAAAAAGWWAGARTA